jgi:hypothetical protein
MSGTPPGRTVSPFPGIETPAAFTGSSTNRKIGTPAPRKPSPNNRANVGRNQSPNQPATRAACGFPGG